MAMADPTKRTDQVGTVVMLCECSRIAHRGQLSREVRETTGTDSPHQVEQFQSLRRHLRSEEQPILVPMRARSNRFRQLPDHHLDDGAIVSQLFCVSEKMRSHYRR